MKNIYFVIAGALILGLFSQCAINKNLQEAAPAQFKQAYATSNDEALQLHLPVVTIQEEIITLESVYFRGMHSDLILDENKPNEYVAHFGIPQSSFVMSADPKEEYGNRPPQLPEASPVAIESDEALLVFSKNGKTKYYKLTGITEKE